MRWGMIPRWCSKPLKEPFFREAFKRTCCIIPASGYYVTAPWTRASCGNGARTNGRVARKEQSSSYHVHLADEFSSLTRGDVP
jgi:hypothetical protein